MVEWAMRHLDEGDYTYPVEPDDSNPLYSAPVAPSPYPLPVEALVFAQPVQDVPGVGPVLTPVDHDPFSTGMKPVDKLLGLGGEERYQTWPERLVRDAVVAPHDVMNNPEPMTSEQMIKPAQDIASLAAGGSMPMAARGTLGALGGKLVQVEHDPFAVAPTFYSAVENAIATNPQTKMSSDQWLGTISNSKGVKPEEIDWIGLKDFLAGKKSVTKQEVLDHVEGNKVELKEVNKGEYKPDQVDEEKYYKSIDKNAQRIFGEPYDHLNDMQQQQIRRSSFLDQNINPTKFSQWQLPGGENYREMLLTLPNQKLEQAAQKLKYFEIV